MLISHEPLVGGGEVQPERDVLGEFVLAPVLVEIRLLHVAQSDLEAFPGQEP